MIDHGGTWIDATVLWTGDVTPDYAFLLDSDLFIPALTFEDMWNCATRVHNYFITARRNNKILIAVRDLLYKYWAKYDVAIEYLLFYDMFELAIDLFPEAWGKVTPFPCANCTLLHFNLEKPYTPELYKLINSHSPFQKLSWRFLAENPTTGTIHDYVMKLPKYNPKEGRPADVPDKSDALRD